MTCAMSSSDRPARTRSATAISSSTASKRVWMRCGTRARSSVERRPFQRRIVLSFTPSAAASAATGGRSPGSRPASSVSSSHSRATVSASQHPPHQSHARYDTKTVQQISRNTTPAPGRLHGRMCYGNCSAMRAGRRTAGRGLDCQRARQRGPGLRRGDCVGRCVTETALYCRSVDVLQDRRSCYGPAARDVARDRIRNPAAVDTSRPPSGADRVSATAPAPSRSGR